MSQNNLNLQYNVDESPERSLEDVLAKVVEEVATDAKIKPSQYLNDSIVPEGGE